MTDEVMDVTEIRVSGRNFEKAMAQVSELMLRGYLLRSCHDPITDEIVYQIVDLDSVREPTAPSDPA